jgi:hypothetical protein
MEDLVSLLIFAGVFIFSLLAGGKKKRAQGKRPPVRPQPAAVKQRPRSAQSPLAAAPTRQPKPGGEPQEMVEGLLDLLRGRIPIEAHVPEVEREARVEMDDEAQSLMDMPDRAQEHREFHSKYVEHSMPATVTSRPRSRYRLTPKTAREAVVWTAIFSKPKGME